jgi:hypothetical protein
VCSSDLANGGGALQNNTTASYNTAVGYQAGFTNTTGAITAFGYRALYTNNTGATGNTAVGYEAALSNTTGSVDAFGTFALRANTTGTQNAAFGNSVGYSNTTGSFNVAFGGFSCFYNNTTGSYNVAVGTGALNANTTASNNTAVGHQAGYYNTTGASNVVIGYQAQYNNNTGSFNIAIGQNALQSNGASSNTAVGYRAGYSNTTGTLNTIMGVDAGYDLTTGTTNTFIGYNAGGQITTGSKNTVIGRYSGNQGGLDIRTASNRIVLSDGDGNPRAFCGPDGSWTFKAPQSGGEVAIFENTSGAPYGGRMLFSAAAPNNTANYFLYCDDTGGQRITMRSNGGLANYSGNNVNLSDAREKTNVELAGSYLDKICAIPVKTFNYIDQNIEEDDGLTLGVIAQDVQAVAPELVMESNWANKDEPEKMRLSIYQTDLQYALMKAIQELKAEVDSLKQQINQQ